jgi:hypothetical protein
MHAGVRSAAIDCFLDLAQHSVRQPVAATDRREPQVLPQYLRTLFDDVLLEQVH